MINLSVPVWLSPCSEIGGKFGNVVTLIIKTLNFNGLWNSMLIDKSQTEMIFKKFEFDKDVEIPDFPVADKLREVASISYFLPIVISQAYMLIVYRLSKLGAWHVITVFERHGILWIISIYPNSHYAIDNCIDF